MYRRRIAENTIQPDDLAFLAEAVDAIEVAHGHLLELLHELGTNGQDAQAVQQWIHGLTVVENQIVDRMAEDDEAW